MRVGKTTEIATVLRERLRKGPVQPGTPAASAREICRQFDVSMLTAHRAINQLVKEDLLYRVRGSGTFIKSGGKSSQLRIGLADSSVPDLSEEMQRSQDMYITYVLNYLREQNCKAKVISYPELINPDHSRELLGGLDGILVSINYIDPTTIRILQESKLPVVTYRHPFEGNFPFSQVITDVDSGMAMAMEQLALPPDEVPVLVYENTPCSQHLRSVFIKHLGKAGFANDRLEQYEVTPGRFSNSCYRLVRVRYKKFRDRIFFVTNDGIASHLINAFLNENMKAGRDYRLVSSGNSEVYGLELPGGPLLASISTPREKKAEESCKLLMYLIRHPGDCQHIVKVPSLFTNRASSTISK